jgi:serine phosphatase RsbU (regulator of sigma subunit)
MSTQAKIMILLALTLGVFVAVFLGYQNIQNRQEKMFLKANEETKTLVIDNILKFKAKIFLGPVNDYSCWDEMVSYVEQPTRKWEEVNLSTLDAFDVSYTWIFNKNHKLVYSIYDTLLFRNDVILSKEVIEHVFENEGVSHFFMNIRDTLFEVTGGTIVPSDDIDHQTEPQGFFFVGKFWSKDYIESLEDQMDFSVNFRLLNQSISNDNPDQSRITITKTFQDAYGKDLMHVDFSSKNMLVSELSSTKRLSNLLLGLMLVVLTGFFIAIRQWITIPLTAIGKSLKTENDTLVDKLANQKTEFGEIAGLIKQFFDQKVQLEIEIAERVETQRMVNELYEQTVNLNHELQASEEELRQNLEVTMELNLALHKQQKEITDSINYAGRIQGALLPTYDQIMLTERDFFILYKPRSIVSGDFYWVKIFERRAFIAVADCTGHGVPGGFMSMLGMAFLSEIVNLSKQQTTGEILDNLRSRVVTSLHQTGKIGESKDGMDISICIIDFDKMTMQFSGAYNPLYLIRDAKLDDGTVTHEFIEIKGDRMPIGYSLRMNVKFTTNEIALKSNDMIYLLTDGFQDQLSGKTMQKFKRNKLRELLMGIYRFPLSEQKNLLDITFEGYRDEYPQIDDLLIFGLKM